jgi:hypothetical protein
LDRSEEVAAGAGDHPGQDERARVESAVRFAAVGDRELGDEGKRWLESALRAKLEEAYALAAKLVQEVLVHYMSA